MKKITIMLVDDHDVVRTGLKSLLKEETDLEVIAEASNGEKAIEVLSTVQPDVIVMDLSMPTMNGLEATRIISEKYPDCLVLALTVHEDKQYLFEMLAAGAKGYITKQAAGEELISAIRAVASGNIYLQAALAQWLLSDYRRLNTLQKSNNSTHQVDAADLEVLSERELGVVELVAEGLTTPEVAKRLKLSPNTISRHRERILKKLGLHSTTDLVKFAIRTGLIDF
ncbi:MAG: response regulator transcription factor [Desulfocapsa sp.]|nr:response regulator transcription factor [Desulfocapsa sp.]